MVKDLVSQFSDPLDFYRELIQNSIDAGSNRIDVVVECAPGPGNRLLVKASVEDDGEGMDEKTIDGYLLVLFKSSKEDDLTKIGKFGIGFVSVFAPQPKLVRILTAKSGESWRLDFPNYRRYEKYRLREPREGTRVELHLDLSREEYERFVQGSLKKVRYWCKHAETRIFFQERPKDPEPALVNEPFGLEGESLRYSEEGTEIALAFSEEPEPFYGFYNRGLTLKEGKELFFPGVAFKVKSRWLEHTLTRDNVMRDKNFQKTLGLVRRLSETDLAEKLETELEALAREADPAKAAREWSRRLPCLKALFEGFWAKRKRADWKLIPTVEGRALSMSEVRRAAALSGGKLYHDAARTPVAAKLLSKGVPVLLTGPWLGELEAFGGEGHVFEASSAFILPRLIKESEVPMQLRTFLTTLRWADKDSGAKYRSIQAADFAYPGSSISERMFVAQRAPGELSSPAERPRSSLLWFGKESLHALINPSDSFVRSLAVLHETRPGLAAYLCLKVLHLTDGEVPPGQEERFCNLAEKLEERLLASALKLDSASAIALGRAR